VFDAEHIIDAHSDFNILRGSRVIKTGVFDKARDLIRLVEIKGIDRADVDWRTLDGPLGEHTLQGSLYYHLYKRNGYRVDRNISYLYGERSLKETLFRGEPWKEFEVAASPYERIAPFLDKAMQVKRGVAERKVPPRTVCDKDTCGRAKNCPVAHLCFEISANGYKKSKNLARKKAPQRKELTI
jgi:hypothetical protein